MKFCQVKQDTVLKYNENHEIAIAMPSSRADPVLGLNIHSFEVLDKL